MKVENFAILSGNATTIQSGAVQYFPEFEKAKDSEETNTTPIGAAIRADKTFYQGTLQFKNLLLKMQILEYCSL